MIIVPLYLILLPYLFFLLGFITFALVNAGHLVKTGTLTSKSFAVTFIFISYTVIILGLTGSQLLGVNWQQPMTMWNADWLGAFTSLDNGAF